MNGERNDSRDNIALNLRDLRKQSRLTLEEVAERIGVTRQAVAKWENGDTLPDIINCEALAALFDVSLNDLVRYDSGKEGISIGPKDKHIFGMVTINDKGQIVLPKKARELLGYKSGDTLMVLGDTSPGVMGLALVDCRTFMRMTGHAMEAMTQFTEKKDETVKQ